MRRQYRQRILEHVRKGELGSLVRRASHYARVLLGRTMGRPLAGPILGTLITNYSCNLRCTMCDLPLRVTRYRAAR